TIAKSIAIGNPSDGSYVVQIARAGGGVVESVTEEEILEGMELLARTEGIFAETAGGVTVACARKLIESGKIPRDEEVVLCITGHGLKTQEAVNGKCGVLREIKPSLREFEEQIYAKDNAA
ncbi:MAG TPA: pyridoxal-phosphate dependent enzyme, partial [Chthoniobacteraceae bacterium]|nr:pyridoxal-phosphate dependent enzyme [Chthoniobacteraceae bacterium]